MSSTEFSAISEYDLHGTHSSTTDAHSSATDVHSSATDVAHQQTPITQQQTYTAQQQKQTVQQQRHEDEAAPTASAIQLHSLSLLSLFLSFSDHRKIQTKISATLQNKKKLTGRHTHKNVTPCFTQPKKFAVPLSSSNAPIFWLQGNW